MTYWIQLVRGFPPEGLGFLWTILMAATSGQ